MPKILLISLLLINFAICDQSSVCTCPSSAKAPSTITNKSSQTLSDIVIDGTNYGKPIAVGDLIFLENSVPISSGTKTLFYTCPNGFRLPTKSELETMLTDLGSDASTTLQNTFKFESGKKYMTNEKVYPSNTSGSTNEAWMFYGLVYNKKYVVESVNSYWDGDKMVARCIQDLSDVHLNIDGLSYDLFTNEKRKLTLDTSLLNGFLWRFNGKTYTTNSIEITNTQRGCNLLEIWANSLNNKSIYSCEVVYTIPKLGNSVNSKFDISKVSTLKDEYSTSRISAIYFERPHAPIAPKTDGGYYIAFNDLKEKYMRVVEYDSADKVLNNVLLKSIPNSYPLDIIETDYGFAIYAKDAADSNYSFLATFTSNFEKRTITNIMNNGKSGQEKSDSIIFYNAVKEPLFGLNNMYNPHNGKLAYGKGKLNLIFAHYNYFESSGGHTGDTYYSFETTPSVETTKYAWSWQSSHSLIQSHLYDGRYFITAALGDAYPQGISVNVIDITKKGNTLDAVKNSYPEIKYASDESLEITGNMSGNSMGRLGGLLNFGSFYAVVYSIKPNGSDSRNGIFLTKFTYENQKIVIGTTVNVLPKEAGKIKNVRCAKYGNNILITYVQNKVDYGDGYASYYLDYTETMYYLLVNSSGNVIAGPIQSGEQIAAVSEDIRELKDGSLRWGYVASGNVLKIVKVAAP